MLLRLTVEARVNDEALARLPELIDSGSHVKVEVVPLGGMPGGVLAEGALVGAVESPLEAA